VIAEEALALRQAVIAACTDTDSSGWQPSIWDALVGLGMTAVSVAESAGGAGADMSAAATVLSALGFVGASVPIVEMDLVAGALFEGVGRRLPDGVVTAGVADDVELSQSLDGWRLSGVVPRVPWGRHADWVAVLIVGADPRLIVLSTAKAEIRPGCNVAGEPRDDLVFDGALIPSADAYAIGQDAVAHALRRGAFGRAAQIAGAAQSVYRDSLRYTRERHQFGRPLAAMPVVQQMLAELAAEVCAMTVAVEAAADAATKRPEDTWVLDAARVRVSVAATTVATIGHQIHGAIGFTQEHPLHRATTRLWSWRDEYGSARTLSEQVGDEAARDLDTPLWHRIAI